MAYCTLDDLKKNETEASIIQLTDDDNAGVVDMDNLNDAISNADDYINSKLRGHIALPLALPVSGIITQLSVEFAIVNLYKRRFGSAMPESIMKRQSAANKDLNDIAAGIIIISEEHKAQEPAEAIKISSRQKKYTEEMMDQY